MWRSRRWISIRWTVGFDCIHCCRFGSGVGRLEFGLRIDTKSSKKIPWWRKSFVTFNFPCGSVVDRVEAANMWGLSLVVNARKATNQSR